MNNPYGGGPPHGHGPYGYPQQQQPYGVQGSHGYQGAPQHGAPYGYGGGPPAPPPQPARPRPDPDQTRRNVGLALWIIGIIAGVILNIVFTLAEVLFSKSPGAMAGAIVVGALFAFPPLLVYLFVPTILDRFDPEPWWCLLMAFLWGAITATGFAGMINTVVHIVFSNVFDKETGELVSAAVSAPIAEELWKGLVILGFFYFLRREFDGIVDGIIYAIFCALGFAAVENVSYYARAAVQGQDVLAGTFILRGVFTPWLHPLFTSMTGIGFGLARESENKWMRALGPLAGYCVGVSLHAMWNFLPTALGPSMGAVFVPWLLLWFCFVAAFFAMIVGLVIRKGRVIRDHLRDEVLVGTLTQDDLELVCSPVGRLRCTLSWRGATGRDLIRAASRLALSKWHTARAVRGLKRTISADFVAPLRQDVIKLRTTLASKAPGAVRYR